MWKVINKVLDKATPSTEVSTLDVEGRTITKEKDIAETLNHHFTTIGPKLASKLESRSDDDPLKHVNAQQYKMMFVPVDETYVPNAIKVTVNVFWAKISIFRFLHILLAELSRHTMIHGIKLTEVLKMEEISCKRRLP